MTKNQWKAIALSLAATITSLLVILAALSLAPVPITPQAHAQMTSVNQLSDVQPTDVWYEDLQSLVERYGVIDSFDGTFRGQRTGLRAEAVTILNATLDRVSELIGSESADLVTKEDTETVRRLLLEIQAEVASIQNVNSSVARQ